MVSKHDECWVRLFDKASGELFAECPIPQNVPIITVRLLPSLCPAPWLNLWCIS